MCIPKKHINVIIQLTTRRIVLLCKSVKRVSADEAMLCYVRVYRAECAQRA